VSDIKTDIMDLSERFDEKIEKNENNIRLIGLKINEFADAINRINSSASNNSRADMIDKILDSDMIPV